MTVRLCQWLSRLVPLLAITGSLAAAQFRVLAWDDAVAARKLAVVAAGKVTEIKNLHPLKRTGIHQGPQDGGIVIRALDREAVAGQPVDLRTGIADGITHPLLLLLPDDNSPSGLRGLVIDDGTAAFPWGSFRFLNATGADLVVQLEQRAITIPGGWKPTDFVLDGPPRNVGVRIAAKATLAEPLYTSVWTKDDDVRRLIFLVPGTDARLGKLALKVIPEDKTTVEAESPANKNASIFIPSVPIAAGSRHGPMSRLFPIAALPSAANRIASRSNDSFQEFPPVIQPQPKLKTNPRKS